MSAAVILLSVASTGLVPGPWSDQRLPPATRARMLAKQMRTPPLLPLPCCATANYDAPELICSLLFV